jgi:hypothetical protein
MKLKFIAAMFLIAMIAPLAQSKEKSHMSQNKELITSITVIEQEEEGGQMAVTYFPDGLIKISGHPGSGGYKPLAADGWYEAEQLPTVQGFFNKAKEAVRKNKKGEATIKGPIQGNRVLTTILLNDRPVVFNGDMVGQNVEGIPIYETKKMESSPSMSLPTPKIKKYLGGLDWTPPKTSPKVDNAL